MKFEPIAIVSTSCVLPGALNPEELWKLVVEGRDLITNSPANAWGMPLENAIARDESDLKDKSWHDKGGYVRGFDEIFDAGAYGLASDQIKKLDPIFRWTLHCISKGLEPLKKKTDPRRTGLVFGNLAYYSKAAAEFGASIWAPDLPGPETDPRNRFMTGYPALFAAKTFGFEAGAFSVDAACASSLHAVEIACRKLQDREADLMLAGGVCGPDNLLLHTGFTALKALSPTGVSRPFDRSGDGLLPSEGAAFITLKRLDDAIGDQETILGVIRGVGLANDGRAKDLLSPVPAGQIRALNAAYEMSGLSPADISLVECHATGTPVGDPLEIESMKVVFTGLQNLPIGSLKSNMGHLITASGTAAIIKVLMAMRAGVRPPTLHVKDPIEALTGSPFRLLHEAEPWESKGLKRAGINNFGFGGNNAHLILEEWKGQRIKKEKKRAPKNDPICIVGLEAMAAGCSNRKEFERALFSAAADGETPPIEIAYSELRFPPADLRNSTSEQVAVYRLALSALSDVYLKSPKKTGVFIGMQFATESARANFRAKLPEALQDLGDAAYPWTSVGVLGCMPNIITNRINNHFDFQGSSMSVCAEELSGVIALELGARALRAGALDAAVIGAADMSREAAHEAAARAVLPKSRHKAGDAAVVLVLKRLSDARRDGDVVYAQLSEAVGKNAPQEFSLDSLTGRFAHAHAASGLLHVAAAALCLSRNTRLAPEGAARPWLPSAHARTAKIRIDALGDQHAEVVLEETQKASVPVAPIDNPDLAVFSGKSLKELETNILDDLMSKDGPMRLIFVSKDGESRIRQKEIALTWLAKGTIPKTPVTEITRNVFFGDGSLEGEVAFVYTGAASAYVGMGRDLSLAFPEAIDALHAKMNRLEEAAGWIYPEQSSNKRSGADASDKLWGATYLSQLHTSFTRDILGLKPAAALGISSGETNALYALGVWHDMDRMYAEINDSGLYARELAGEFRAAQRAWKSKPAPRWENWSVRLPVAEVKKALAGEPYAYLMIINAPNDVMVGGEAKALDRVIKKLGRERASLIPFELAIHCSVVKKFAAGWRRLHDRVPHRVSGIRFYTNATNTHYNPSRKKVADALTQQAMETVDFPKTVLNAWEDGVRFFVEQGPRDFCSGWINAILGDRPHAAVSIDAVGRSSLLQACRAAAQLACAGAPVEFLKLEARLEELKMHSEKEKGGAAKAVFPIHRPPIQMQSTAVKTVEIVDAPVAVADAAPVAVAPAPTAAAAVVAASGSIADEMLRYHHKITAMHNQFVSQQAVVHNQFLNRGALASGGTIALVEAPVAPAPVAPPAHPALPGPKWNWEQMNTLASGKISSVFGKMFERQDGYFRQVRMPEPPLLLTHRVTGIDAEPGVLGKGTMWTESDVTWDSWFLHAGRMPAGIFVESGQADLLLISWMGIDFLNQSDRIYRLLGCTLRYHDSLPKVGETLVYDIHVDGHAEHQGTRLFFFHYDCKINGKTRLSMRHGQAGFFTDKELDNSAGIIDPIELEGTDDQPSDPARVNCTKNSFTAAELGAFSAGDAYACFGEGFGMTQTHTRTPNIASGRMLLIDSIPELDPKGGPLGRGYLKAAYPLNPDSWFFNGHFKNDPCMPGTLMIEGCFQAMAVYMTAMGYTTDRDGWRFEPVPEEDYDLKCRGQATPKSKGVIYEIFVRELHDGKVPTLFADVLATVDGHKVFLCKRLGLRLVADWPMTSMRELMELKPETRPVHHDDGFEFGYKAAIACAWGPPTMAFGKVYAESEKTGRRVPRLPGPPFHFITRATRVSHPSGIVRPGVEVEIEYEIPSDAWYFSGSGHPVMPHCVLAEAALQTCGWISSYLGIGNDQEGEFFFRNLDGKGTILAEIPPDAGILRTVTTIDSISNAGGMVVQSYTSRSFVGEVCVYELKSVFGHFPAEALAKQVGIPPKVEDRKALDAPSDFLVTMSDRPAKYFNGTAHLPTSRLLAIDRVSGYWPEGGEKGLGRLRAEYDVDPGAWFFKAHFYSDPVQPGSMGFEMMLQMLQVFMLEKGMHHGIAGARFEPVAINEEAQWKYRGQVVPKDKKVTVTIDILEEKNENGAPTVVASGWMWVDGRRIYNVVRIGMRIVPGEKDPNVLDPATEQWIGDHRPTQTRPALPMMFMVDRLAAAAAAHRPELKVVGLRNVKVIGWLILDEAKRLSTVIKEKADGVFIIELSAEGDGGKSEPICSGEVLMAGHYSAASTPVSPLAGLNRVEPLPYETGSLFHGPSFHVLESLHNGLGGASGTLAAHSDEVPFGCLNQLLLDGAFHVLPNDDFSIFSGELPADHIGYPLRVEEFKIYGPAPTAGSVRCEARYEGFHGGRTSGIIRNRIQYVVDNKVWADLTLLSLLLPKGRMVRLSSSARKGFLSGGMPVSDTVLLELNEGGGRVRESEVKRLAWFPNMVEDVYGVSGSVADMTEAIAVKEHVALLAGAHPRDVEFNKNDSSARCRRTPLNLYPISLKRVRGGTSVSSAGATRLDLESVFSYAENIWGGRHPFLEDFFTSLANRFVGRVVFPQPDTHDALRGRAALYLSNYQCRIESILTPFLFTYLTGSPTTVLAKTEHERLMIGKLINFISSCPGYKTPTPNLFVDKEAPIDFLRVVSDMASRFREGHSVMVHVEGTRQLDCRAPVANMSSVFSDLAVRENVPIVPVKYAGGLPRKQLEKGLVYPYGYARQDYWIGAPIEAEELTELLPLERKKRVLDAINFLGPVAEEEHTPDLNFDKRVRAWTKKTGATTSFTVILKALIDLESPCDDTVKIVEGARKGKLTLPATEHGRWLADFAKLLYGPRGPVISSGR
ncbi:MAG: beta-ketoacyl synthase [Elusimicrobia bacterium]|nr:MAG: beta-ketoacyl synthase [Elusimicrobiota bacterium]